MNSLPPTEIRSAASWTGSDKQHKNVEWVWWLNADEIAELHHAALTFLASNEGFENISPDNFKLNQLSGYINKLKSTLINGQGFCVVRGLCCEDFSEQELSIMFLGFGAHLGQLRSQNADGHLLGHVRNTGADASETNTRIYQTNNRQTFHTDSCDVVSLLCLKEAKRGGDSLLVSAESIYNKMRKSRPDLLKLLFEPVATDKRGEVEPGTEPFFTIPVFSWHDEKLCVIYQRQYIDSAQRFDGAPGLSTEHIEALDLFDRLANDEQLYLSMHLHPGDMQFVYNHNMLHDRTEFEDWSAGEGRRHLLRLWLSIDGDRALPDAFCQRFGTTKIGDRGGVIVSGTELKVLIG